MIDYASGHDLRLNSEDVVPKNRRNSGRWRVPQERVYRPDLDEHSIE